MLLHLLSLIVSLGSLIVVMIYYRRTRKWAAEAIAALDAASNLKRREVEYIPPEGTLLAGHDPHHF